MPPERVYNATAAGPVICPAASPTVPGPHMRLPRSRMNTVLGAQSSFPHLRQLELIGSNRGQGPDLITLGRQNKSLAGFRHVGQKYHASSLLAVLDNVG